MKASHEDFVRHWKESHEEGATMIKACLDHAFAYFGLARPETRGVNNDLEGLCDYLEVCLEVWCLGGRVWGELNAKKAAHTLAQSFWSLIPAGAATTVKCLSKQDLRSMKETSFVWPNPQDLSPEGISRLAKNMPLHD